MTTTTKKAAAKKATPAKKTAETPEARRARLEEKAQRELEARQAQSREELEELEAAVTQREWLLICRRLEVTRNQIDSDYGLRLLALAWVNEKRKHGGAEWDKLLNATDDELMALLGYAPDGSPLDTPAE